MLGGYALDDCRHLTHIVATLDNESLLGDRQLMNGVLRRLPESLEQVYKRYGTVLKSIIMQVLHNEAEAEDVLQEVFLQVWDRAPAIAQRRERWWPGCARSQGAARLIACGSRMPNYALPTATRCHANPVTASTNRTLLNAKTHALRLCGVQRPGAEVVKADPYEAVPRQTIAE
jgi:hypothetical protein